MSPKRGKRPVNFYCFQTNGNTLKPNWNWLENKSLLKPTTTITLTLVFTLHDHRELNVVPLNIRSELMTVNIISKIPTVINLRRSVQNTATVQTCCPKQYAANARHTFSPKMEMYLFGMKALYFHTAAFDLHYFSLANQSVWLSGQMRSSYTDKRGFSVFICCENIHIDTLLSTLPTRTLHRRLHRLQAEGPGHWHDSG